MRNVVIVGKPRAGKSHEAKRLAVLAGLPLVVNDVNSEWGQRPLDLSEFLDIADRRKGQPTTFVWEEATSYLDAVAASGKDKKRTVNALVRRFHTKHFNVLLFHSLRTVPVWVMDYTDRLILFPTADRPSLIRSKFRGWDAIMEPWERVNDPQRPVIATSPRGDRIVKPEDVSIFGA
jgi:hypothetical protein